MKKIIFSLTTVMLFACGGPVDQKEEAISSDQEAEIVETITNDLKEAQEELKVQTEEGINEIDSLLENF